MTTALLRTAAVLAAVLLLPALATAADAAGGSKNILQPDLVNSIVTLVVFGVLLAILYAFAWGPILKGLQAREAAQFQAIEDSKRAKAEAEALRVSLEAEKAKAAEQVRTLMEEARRDAEALKVSEREAGVREAQAERERAGREISAEREAALKDVYAQAVELATLMATKAARQQITVEKQSQLVQDSIAELNATASRA